MLETERLVTFSGQQDKKRLVGEDIRLNTMNGETAPAQIEAHSEFGILKCYADDLITEQVKDFGNHTRPEFAFATCVLDHDMNVFDLGAHIGTFSLVAHRKLAGQGKVLSVEGNPVTFEMLQHNIQTRYPDSSTCLNAFVGSGAAMEYEVTDGNSGAGRLVPKSGTSEGMATHSIDELVGAHFAPDYLKIDVEGMEHLVLADTKLVRDKKPIIYMEVSNELLSIHGHSGADLDGLLTPLGYRYFVNVGDRNAKHDVFQVMEIKSLTSGHAALFDVLCVPSSSPKLKPLEEAARNQKANIKFAVKSVLRPLKRRLDGAQG